VTGLVPTTKQGVRQFIRKEKKYILENGLNTDPRYSRLMNMQIINQSIRSDAEIDDAIFSLVSPVYKDSVFKFADWMKGKDAFYLMNSSMELTEEEEKTFFAKLVRDVTKSVNYEKVVRYALYFLTGWASKDFTEYSDNIDVKKFKKKCAERCGVQSMDELATKGQYDGSMTDEDGGKYFGFAFSDTDNPESQGEPSGLCSARTASPT
jgi:hypothetical protein